MSRMILALSLLAIALLAFALAGCRQMLPKTVGSPIGLSARTGKYIATLIATGDPTLPTLTPNRPRQVHYRLALLLTPLTGGGSRRLLPVAANLDYRNFEKDARVLGDDGRLLWFFTTEIGAFDLPTEKLISTADLQRANPGLAEPWNGAKFELRKRLAFLTHDYRQTYEIDPETLRAEPAEPLDRRYRAALTPASFLTSGGMVSGTEWFGVHPPSDLASSYKPGLRLPRDPAPRETSERRRFYRGVIEASLTGPRVVSMTPLNGQEYLYGALLRASRDGELLRLANPEAFLLTYQTSRLDGSLMAARVDRGGHAQWTVNTGIGVLDQILPGEDSLALVGKRPRVPDKLPEPILVILNLGSGATVTHSLQQK